MSVARRSLQSVTHYQPDKTYNGFTLFSPLTVEPPSAWLMDMQGWFVHRWELPGLVSMHAELLPNGNLLTSVWDPEGPIASLSQYAGGEVIELDWDSNIVWRYKEPYMNSHDRVRLPNGNTLIAKFVPTPKEIAAKVKGGFPGTEWEGNFFADNLQEITPSGEIAWEWVGIEHLDPELDALDPICARYAWSLWNSIVELPDGNVMTCSPYTSNLYIIDKKTGEIKWRWGRKIMSWPHNPTVLDNGNILVFDNGAHRWNSRPPIYSRVLEVNPSTEEIEWEYRAENPVDFYSSCQGGAQRLPNGNTLICESTRGRFFEVTPIGEIVWEYVVPFYAKYVRRVQPGAPKDYPHFQVGLSSMTYRCLRYGPDYPGLQGKRLDPGRLSLWNHLYGPRAFRPGMAPFWAPVPEAAPPVAEGEPAKGVAKEPAKPSLAKPKAKTEEEYARRIRSLGY